MLTKRGLHRLIKTNGAPWPHPQSVMSQRGVLIGQMTGIAVTSLNRSNTVVVFFTTFDAVEIVFFLHCQQLGFIHEVQGEIFSTVESSGGIFGVMNTCKTDVIHQLQLCLLLCLVLSVLSV